LPESIVAQAVCLGSAGFDPPDALGHRPHPIVFSARFPTIKPQSVREKVQPQFRFLDESLITKGEFGLLQSLIW